MDVSQCSTSKNDLGNDVSFEEQESTDEGQEVTKGFTPAVPLQYIPSVGTQFDSYDDAYDAYNVYAKMKGFGTKKLTSKKSRGVVCWALFTCNKQGFKKQKGDEKSTKVNTRCGCNARMIVKLCPKVKKWVVKAHHVEHNHILQPSSKIHMRGSIKGFRAPYKHMIDTCLESGMKTSQRIDAMPCHPDSIQNVPFNEAHLYESLQKSRMSYLGNDWCHIVLKYFQKKRLQNSDFYYAIQTNEDGQVANLLWVDAHAREDHYYFGDVISFDTTYKKNGYLTPFAPFIGANHHNQSIIFGCALLVDETKDSFVWVFKEWLNAMGGRPPTTMITGQDPNIKAAAKEVFPTTIHKCCIWHMMQNIPKYVSNLGTQYPNFESKWNIWFYESEGREEFEARWLEMTTLFPEILQIKWLNDLWSDRFTWASHYSPDTFMAGISTTQRSESMNKMFKKWVDASTPLHLFLETFDEAIERRRCKEKKYDFRMRKGVQPCSIESPLLLHIQDVFTPSLFTKFQKEFEKVIYCHAMLEFSAEGIRTYKVIHDLKDDSEKVYIITYKESTQELSNCKCRLWNFAGIVCCHMFTVFKVERIRRLPEHYIFKRWSRQAKIGARNDYGLGRTEFQQETSIVEKKNVFFFKVQRCLKEALRYDETYSDALAGLDRLTDHLQQKNVDMDKSTSISIDENEIANVEHGKKRSGCMTILIPNDEGEKDYIVLPDQVCAKGNEKNESCVNASADTSS